MGTKLIHWILLISGYLTTVSVYSTIPSSMPLSEDPQYQSALNQEREKIYKENFRSNIIPELTKELVAIYKVDQYLNLIDIEIDEELLRWQESIKIDQNKIKKGLIQFLEPGVTRDDALLVGQFIAAYALSDSITNFSMEMQPFVFETKGNSRIFSGETIKNILNAAGDEFVFILVLMIDSDFTGIKDENEIPLMMYYDRSEKYLPGMVRLVKDTSFIAELIGSGYLEGISNVLVQD